MPMPRHCIDCEKPTLGTNALCPNCLNKELQRSRVRQSSGVTGNDRPATTADLEQDTEPQEINR